MVGLHTSNESNKKNSSQNAQLLGFQLIPDEVKLSAKINHQKYLHVSPRSYTHPVFNKKTNNTHGKTESSTSNGTGQARWLHVGEQNWTLIYHLVKNLTLLRGFLEQLASEEPQIPKRYRLLPIFLVSVQNLIVRPYC